MKIEQIKNFLHGGDYNPDQWLNQPEVLEDDIKLMKLAGVNVVTLGVFSWSSLEPQEGIYTFDWLDQIMDTLHANDIYVILATPSVARPPWMAKKYPEVMRTGEDRVRMLYGGRENHCESSEVWRNKVCQIDEKLAERYANHPALIMWHISNEMYGRCYCEKCATNFRKWLEKKYGSIEQLNKQYWSAFWSHRYTSFEEIEPPAKHGEKQLHGLVIDYHRFYSDLQIDFVEMEKDAVGAGFTFDYVRAFNNKPFYLMESVPSVPSQFVFCKVKRPKLHMLSAIQTIAYGADSVQYFQWRKSNGAVEKFHGSVIDHNGSANTRVFRDVCEVGAKLQELSYMKGTDTKAEVAIIYDYDNIQALNEQVGLRKDKSFWEKLSQIHYEALLKNYVNVDVISADADFSRYKVITAPGLYMFKPDTAEKIREFVEKGGSFVLTYYSGLVNENDLCFSGTLANPVFAPYSLNDVFGIKVKETDGLCDDEYNELAYNGRSYKVLTCCDLLEAADAVSVAEYSHDFYAGMSAVTKKQFGNGNAYYLACHTENDFLYELYKDVLEETKVSKIVNSEYVKDVMVRERDGHIFVMNFSTQKRVIKLYEEEIMLDGYGYVIV